MRVAAYARVSTTRQAQAQGIEQQLDRLRAAAAERGWDLDDQHVYRDDGYSGARIGRPGLDRLRDHAALAELDVVLVTAPDRLARNYVHQVLLIDELAARGCQVEFLDRPMSADPHDQLLLQIRGAVAEYERTLIAERMRRGRQARLRAGTLLPWTTAPFGYRLDPDRPRRADAVRVEPGEATLVAQLFDWYLEPQATVYQLARRLTDLGVPTPRGGSRWNVASVRGILRNPSYAGRALSNRTQVAPARGRKSAMLPAGPGVSHAPRPEPEWITVPVPPIVSEEAFAQVQAKLDANQQGAARNTRHEYLLRALISCGACRLGCTGRQTAAGYRYYLCRGRTDPLRVAQGQRCTARYIPAGQLDELVWADLSTATFEQRRQLAELLIDRVVVTDGDVEIRYVLPISPDGPHRPFCQLRKDHLDFPADLRDGDQPGQRHRLRCPAPVERQRSRVAVPAGQQHAVPVIAALAGGVVTGHLQHGPVVVAQALAAVPGAHPVPGIAGDQPGGLGCGHGPARAGGDGVVSADRQHIPHAAAADRAAQLPPAVDLVAGHEGGTDPALVRTGQQLPGQLRLGREHHFPGHAGQLPVLLIGRASPRQVQRPADQRVATGCGEGQGHGHLAQRDPPT